MQRRAKSIERLITGLNKLPGIGTKTAQRLAYHIIEMDEEQVRELSDSMLNAKLNIKKCKKCQNFTDDEICEICSDHTRDKSTICVVEYPKDIEALERSSSYHGLYYVLHGIIYPSKAVHAEELKVSKLIERIRDEQIKELIIATNPTPQGEITALYISKMVNSLGVKVTRIGYGLPAGGDLDYYDEMTITTALENRRVLED